VSEFSPAELEFMREQAKLDLYWFARLMFVSRKGIVWQEAPHHRKICDALMRVFLGDTKRLIINIPPRYSKTELAVVNFIPWALGHFPDCEFIHTSYSADLAGNNTWQARDIVTCKEYREVFDSVQIDPSINARDHWRTSAGGVVYARGSGGTITGYGAGKVRPQFGGAIIIDDPHKADEARSDTIRKGVIEWYQNTLSSRLNDPKNTPIILIMQRLHEEDLAGWLLAGGTGEKWEHVCMPALRDDGTALWPAKHDVPDLRRMEQASPYTFSGQYQQRPTPAEGGIFKPDEMPLIDRAPDGTRWLRAWDLAGTQDGGDWTAGGLLGETPDKRYVIGDMVRLQGRPEVVEKSIRATAERDTAMVRISLPQDPGQAGKSQVQYLTRALAGFTVSASPETGDKITRAEPFAAQLNIGNVSLLRGAWNADLLHEMRHFPLGKHDDQIDALSRAFNQLTLGYQQVSSFHEPYVHAALRVLPP
jgi:predicted phage terminase large subunit-like protein